VEATLSIPMSVAALVALLSSAQDPYDLARQATEAYRAGDDQAAAARYREMVALVPSSPGALAGLGRSLARQGKTAEALDCLAKAADMGAGTDVAALEEAFGPARARPEVQALLARFRENLSPMVRSDPAFRLAERDLFPESVAHDPADGAFYVGSLHKRKIVVVRDGVARDFVPAKAHGLGAVLGMKVDAARRELWANSCHGDSPPALLEPEPARAGETALLRFELAGERRVSVFPAGSRSAPLCFNDLALTPGGDVFLSTGPDGVYRLERASGRLGLFLPTPGLSINGIAASPDGARLYLADGLRGIVAVDVASRALRPIATPPGGVLGGIDGLYVHGASLVGVQNGLAAGPERVVQAFLDPSGDRIACVRVLERSHPDYEVPTTGVIVGDSLYYVAGSQLDRVDEAGRPLPIGALRESTILRLPLAGDCVTSP
jgi:hypothetical protein